MTICAASRDRRSSRLRLKAKILVCRRERAPWVPVVVKEPDARADPRQLASKFPMVLGKLASESRWRMNTLHNSRIPLAKTVMHLLFGRALRHGFRLRYNFRRASSLCRDASSEPRILTACSCHLTAD